MNETDKKLIEENTIEKYRVPIEQETFKNILKDKRITQVELCKQLKYPRGHFNHHLNDENCDWLPINDVERIFEIFGISYSEYAPIKLNKPLKDEPEQMTIEDIQITPPFDYEKLYQTIKKAVIDAYYTINDCGVEK